MRVYFEKPRTTIGWKGLINDPFLNHTFDINAGLKIIRKLLIDINELGVPATGEFLDMILPQYLADLMNCGEQLVLGLLNLKYIENYPLDYLVLSALKMERMVR